MVPTWKNGKRWIYKSPGYQEAFERGDDTSLTTSLDSSVITASNPPSSSSPAIHETPKKSIQNPNESSRSSGLDPEIICQICKVTYESPEDIETDSHWVNCGNRKGCNWWVHTVCANIFYPNNDDNEKKLDSWASKHFFCKRHMPKPEKIGWDATKNCEVHVGQLKKKKIVKLKRNKSSDKK